MPQRHFAIAAFYISQLQHSCYVSDREDDQEYTMNRIPFPAKTKANAEAQPEFEPYYLSLIHI